MKKIDKQNIFIFASILFIATLFFVYSGRLIYYKVFEKKKVEAITSLTERIINKDILFKENNDYYFKGKTNSNYVIYSSQLWQIAMLNDQELTLVSVKPIANLYFDNNYEESIVNEYLTEDFYSILDKSLLLTTTTCINDITNKDDCSKKYSDYVTLPSFSLYEKLGGKESIINNGYYTYLSNEGTNNYYIDLEGNIGTTSNKDLYGIKAIIKIKNTDIISGNGFKNDPYILDKAKTKLSEANVGSYVNYSNMMWRIIKNETEARLICNEKIDNYADTIFEEDSDLYQYLNTEFIKELDSDYLVESKFYNGKFIGSTKYLFTKIYAKVGLPYLLDFYLNDIDNYFLMTKSANSNLAYKVESGYTSIVDDKEYGIRPIISIKNDLKIKGTGTINDPYIIEGELDEA